MIDTVMRQVAMLTKPAKLLFAVLLSLSAGTVLALDPFDGWRIDRQSDELRAARQEDLCLGIAPLWRTRLKGGIRSSPVVGYGWLFVGTDANLMYALKAGTGQTVWTYAAQDKISAPAAVQHLKDVADPTLWFPAENGVLYALNARTGALLWTRQGGYMTWNSSVNVRVPRHIFSVYSNGVSSTLRAVNGVTGAVLWEKSIGNITTATPMVLHTSNLIIQGVAQVGDEVQAFGTQDGAAKWHLSEGVTGSSAYTSGAHSSYWDTLYISNRDGTVDAYNLRTLDATGAPLRLWRATLPNPGPVWGFALAQSTDSTRGIVIAAQSHHTYALIAATGNLLWTVSHQGNLIDSTTRRTPMPAIHGAVVVHVENGDRLVARRIRNGEEVWNYVLDGPVVGAPALANKTIFVGTKAGTLYAFSQCRCIRRW
jgi:outer membrane protein assembly factor BamB